MEFNAIKHIYFIGIGGIGMSALARYFKKHGAAVYGYDRTETALTRALAAEGMHVHYEDNVSFIPENIDLVVYTPAVPKDHAELNWFRQHEYPVMKRAEVLECYATTGDADFTLRVVARDIADYDRFLQTFLFQLPGVSHVRSSIALREIKYTTDLPLEAP